MHYYQFNIGDYASHTSRLSPMEDLAYRRLLDLYYLSEQPLNGCATELSREVGLIEYIDSVEYVLSKFFTKDENVFRQKRIDLEIKKYKSNHKSKVKGGKASAKARRDKALKGATGVEQVLNTCSTGEQLNINHKPLTNNHIEDKESVDNSPNTDAPPKPKTKYKFNDDQMGFAVYMLDKIKSVNPQTDEANLKDWADTIRKLEELDKRTPGEITEIFDWANSDSFWQTNIRSPLKLRKQWSELHAQRQAKTNHARPQGQGGKTSAADRVRENGRRIIEEHGDDWQ